MNTSTLVLVPTGLAVTSSTLLETSQIWGSIVAGIVSLLVVGVSVYGWVRRRWRLTRLFEVYYEDADGKRLDSYTSHPSESTQTTKVTLRLKAEITIQNIALTFKGDAQVPIMREPHDHQFDTAHDGIRYKQYRDGGWNLTPTNGAHGRIGRRIRIGLPYTAIALFSGNLEVYLASEEGANKHILLPFRIVPPTLDRKGSPTE